jgi:basic membrane protein A
MSWRRAHYLLPVIMLLSIVLNACASSEPGRVCVVLDTAGENDKSFNEFTLKGARETANELELEFAHIVARSNEEYLPAINNFVEDGCKLIITVGFLMKEATAIAAKANPDVKFAIIDTDYFPGDGSCPEGVSDCYSAEGGLNNVTSLTFAEDEVGYLAGTLAGCMTETGVIGSVSGMEIPPVVRFVTGYQNGARAQNPDVQTLNVYIPEFNDAYTGKQEGDKQITAGADVIFGVGGNAGNGGILAAHDLGLMAIGVDVDQYFTFPEVGPSLLSSAAKNVDVAAAGAVRGYAVGQLTAGIKQSTVANGGVGLTPFHEWQERIPQECKIALETAKQGLVDGTIKANASP